MKLVAIVAAFLGCANAFAVRPTLAVAPGHTRTASPAMIINRFRNLLNRGGKNDGGGDADAAGGGDAAPAPAAAKLPKPVSVSDEKKLSGLDSLLVKFGMKNEDECEVPEEGEDLMEQIKCAGRAGIVSYIIWEWIFWLTAIPIASYGYYTATGAWPDFSNDEDKAKVAASVFAFVNVARFAVPLRVGLALSTTPWVDENIVSRFVGDDDDGS